MDGPVGERSGLLVERLDDSREERIALAFHPQSVAVHPLVARGRTLGALAVALSPPRERFTPAELALGEELAGRVGIALDNARLYLQVRDNDRRKDEFLAMLAHELRSPLAPIRNAIEVLRVSGTNEARMPWARDVIDRQSRQLMRIVDDLLDVSRITSGKIQLKTEDVDVGAVLSSAVETSRPLIEERRHELEVTPPSKTMYVRGDFARIAQVIANLLNNAAKYTPPGGKIAISATEEKKHVVFRVQDSGLGIPGPMLDGIFDLFIQLDTTLDRAQGGLGIGLTLVKRLVEAQGGKVQASSGGVNQGSEFTVWLPLVNAAPRTVGAPKEAGKKIVGQRILIVEDHPDTAQTLATLVALDGHEVQLARDGATALEMAPQFLPEVMLIDIGLPGMDGFEVARRIRKLDCGRGCMLVAVTGYGQERDRRQALEALSDVICSRQRVTETQ
jgi:signal transduction histidine kinase